MYTQTVTLVSVSPGSSSLLSLQMVRLSLSPRWSLFYSLLWVGWLMPCDDLCMCLAIYKHAQMALPAGCMWKAKITLRFPRLFVSSYVSICNCVSALIMCPIIMSRTLLPCNLTLVDLGNLDDCFV